MRFEVPQFIEIEDKIFGPFTWRQFVFLLGGVGWAVVLFLVAPLLIFVLFGVPVAALAGALAFVPVNNQPFSVFLEAMVNFYRTPHTYYWERKRSVVYRGDNPTTKANGSTDAVTSVMNHNNLSSLSRELELQAIQRK